MNKELIKSLLEKAFQQSTKTPSLWQLPKTLQIKNQLEAAKSVQEVVSLLEHNSTFLQEALGLNHALFTETVNRIKGTNESTTGN
ncbi:MAG: hypothetical protein KGN31_04250 [Betaproteobacteria bacterium]|nr:hypothetical protein [Betaproteobacteria bacterium]MDE2423406.1 hypothetical protein [Betaproteobacteria bacterium]